MTTSYFVFQATLEQMFPFWEDVKKLEDVVIFTCGLMESPIPLVDHAYELYTLRELTWAQTNTWDKQREKDLRSQGEDVLDKRLYNSLYAESKVPLPGKPFHNHHINLFNDKEDNQNQAITILSKVYWFDNMKKHVRLDIKQSMKQGMKQNISEIAMLGIFNPARELTKGLFSTWRKLSGLQPLTELFMRKVRNQDLTKQDVPELSKNAHSLWVIDSELPVAFWRNILQQLIGCPTLQLLWLQETNVGDVEEDLDKLLESIMSIHHQRKLTLFLQNKLSERFKVKWRNRCEGIRNIKCDVK